MIGDNFKGVDVQLRGNKIGTDTKTKKELYQCVDIALLIYEDEIKLIPFLLMFLQFESY